MAPRLLILGRGFIAMRQPSPALSLPHTAVHDGSLPPDIDAVLWVAAIRRWVPRSGAWKTSWS